ncbi:hypothetical protein [Sphingobacterium bovisgrunnientis]|uniref:hypothetical protein n=1 Tax=Sphingobacterium bovisgrunnientis TaxID=1874697 RepID=UPI001357328D|nr:hypothetical protein [Sphingobacterium bovisgrunnientis]
MIIEDLGNRYKIMKERFNIIITKHIIKKETLKIILIKLKDIPLEIRKEIIKKKKKRVENQFPPYGKELNSTESRFKWLYLGKC